MNENKNTGFELTQEELDMLDKTADYLKVITDFSDWCTNNVETINLKECYYIFEDFVKKSNEHIIQKINHYHNHKQTTNQ